MFKYLTNYTRAFVTRFRMLAWSLRWEYGPPTSCQKKFKPFQEISSRKPCVSVMYYQGIRWPYPYPLEEAHTSAILLGNCWVIWIHWLRYHEGDGAAAKLQSERWTQIGNIAKITYVWWSCCVCTKIWQIDVWHRVSARRREISWDQLNVWKMAHPTSAGQPPATRIEP